MSNRLSKFRVGDTDLLAATTPTWVLRPLAPRFTGTLLAVDQSLGAAGWAFIAPDGEVLAQGVVKGVSEGSGHEGTLEKGSQQFLEFRGLIQSLAPRLIAHETPPVSRPGSKMSRPESSLVSANSLRNAAISWGVPVVMVGAQRAKHRFTGKRDADKREVRAALQSLDPTLDGRKPMNEHIYDSIALGWVAQEEAQ